MIRPFTGRSRQILAAAMHEVAVFRSEYVGVEHLLLALTARESPAAVTIHEDLVSSCAEIRRLVGAGLSIGTGSGSRSVPQTPAARESLMLAIQRAELLDHPAVSPEHLFLGILDLESEPFVELIRTHPEIEIGHLRNQLIAASHSGSNAGPAS